jgi:catechol 2,3-dioxygenase-like lactoylglutathione lyase family enzyme
MGMLERGDVATRLPAQDLERAKRFYGEKLGLQPAEERPGGLLYRGRSGEFALFESAGPASGAHTQMSWEVDDVDATVTELRDRGVVFEEVDLPGLQTAGGIAEVEGNYPSKGGVGERAAWFRDSEGNLVGIGQRVDGRGEESPEGLARAIVDSNLYMTLGTADGAGQPWASPVYYAVADYTEFFWVSKPQATHSRNIAARPEAGIVIFNSHSPINTGGGLYMSAAAEELTGDDLDRGVEIFSRRSQAHGAGDWTRADVQEPAALRLYCARASEHFVLDRHDRRLPVNLARGAR